MRLFCSANLSLFIFIHQKW